MSEQPEAFQASEGQAYFTPAYGYVIEHTADNVHVFMTGWERPVNLANMPARFDAGATQVFAPAQVRHGSNSQSAEFSKRTVDVTVWTEDERLRLYFLTAAATKIRIFILRFSSDRLLDPDAVLDYTRDVQIVNSGLIGMVSMAGQQITVTLTPEPHLVSQAVPRMYFQRTCNHPLYGVGCTLNKADFAYVTTIAALDRATRTITLAANPIPAVNAEWFRDGFFLHGPTGLNFPITTTDLGGPGGLLRFKLRLWNPLLTVGDELTSYPGCRHTLADCNAKFHNTANFGGFPRVPNRNPTIHGV